MKLLAFLLLAGCLTALSAQDEGVPPSWEIEELGQKLEQNTAAVAELLVKVRPKEWIQDGAPQGYVNDHEELTKELGHLQVTARALKNDTAKLSVVVETFLWMDRLQSMVRSFSTGVRKYQSGPVADLVETAWGHNTAVMEELKQYMRQLAIAREAEWEIIHSEAQRCRASIARQPGGQD